MDKIHRKELDITATIMDTLILMAEGNPGALNVLIELEKSDNLVWAMHLDDMNIRGTQIWLGYKDYCKQDLNKFVE